MFISRMLVIPLAFTLWCGCSNRPPRLVPPALDPDRAGKDALAEYDSNGDGLISDAELDRSPGLKLALKDINADKDGRLAANEIANRLKLWREGKVAVTSVTFSVTLDGEPLQGATVTLQPEKFLGPAILPATGKTNEQGWVIMTVDDPKLAERRIQGMHLGLYRVEISKKQDGNELLPAKYNTHTELGLEVSHDGEALEGLKYELHSK